MQKQRPPQLICISHLWLLEIKPSVMEAQIMGVSVYEHQLRRDESSS